MAPDALDVYLDGGTAVEVPRIGRETELLFVSGGQDALESLDATVVAFHDAVLRARPSVDVAWEELPLEH